MSRNAKRVVEAVAAESEAPRNEAMPVGVEPVKPHKTTTIATRLTVEDVSEIEALAERLDVPVSALIRGWILAGLAGRKDDSVSTALDRLTADVQRLRELVA